VVRVLIKTLWGVFIAVLLLASWLIWLGWFSVRPPLTIDPETLAGDGSTLNYCALPLLDDSGSERSIFPRAIRRAAPTTTFRCRFWPSALSHCRLRPMTSAGYGAECREAMSGTWSA